MRTPALPRKLSVNSVAAGILGENPPSLPPGIGPGGDSFAGFAEFMLILLFRCLARLPLSWLQGAGAAIGLVLYALPGRYRQRLRAHARQAGHPDARFARRAAAHAGALMLETAWVWQRTPDALRRVTAPRHDVLAAAQATGRPIVFITPHVGNYELAARYAAQHAPVHVLYRPPRKAALNPLIESLRNRDGVVIATANRQGLRQIMRALRERQQVGILPDQVPAPGEGAWADFYGRPAYTVTLPARLAQDDDVLVVGGACARLPCGRGWRLHIEQIDTRPGPSAAEQAQWVNDITMRLIDTCPEQYLWSYNRYKQP